MTCQLRHYKVKAGQMEAFLEAFQGALRLREQHGFTACGAWIREDADEFVWVAGYEGDAEAFTQAEAAYYASPERAGLENNPADYLDGATTFLMQSI